MKRILFIESFPLVMESHIGNNVGNYVYYFALRSYFFGLKNVIYLSPEEIKIILSKNPDWIRQNFDVAIMAEANLFALCYKDSELSKNTDFVKSLKIPVFILGIGCQNDIDNNLENLSSINDAVKNYVDTVLASGGMLTLRGNLTGDYLKSLGYKDIPVLGCPSMYINGANFHIVDDKVSKEKFKPMFNAQKVQDINRRLYKDWPTSVFFDQYRYLIFILNPLQDNTNNNELYNNTFINLYKQGRIKGDINYYPWVKQITDNGFNFAYGSRIHGNIIAIQSGIPAFVKVIDSRTREIAEFYGIPNSLEYQFNESNDSLYDLYQNISFKKFNNLYKDKFNNFKEFLLKITEARDEDIMRKHDAFIKFLSEQNYPSFDSEYNTGILCKQRLKKLCYKTFMYNICKYFK